VSWALLFSLVLASASTNLSLVDSVDPFIGTGGHGHTFPGASVPFGMVQLSPDTRLSGWDGCSGYHYSDDVVYGFSHTHLSGTGVSDYGDILLMPVSGPVFLDNGATRGVDRGYAGHFAKSREEASPGYYHSWLSDYEVDVELTATCRAGLHRYHFPPGRPAAVVLDLTHRDHVLDSEIVSVSDREIAGYRRSSQWAADQVVYFVAQTSRPFKLRLAKDDEFVTGVDSVRGKGCKAVLDFGDDAPELLIRVGISAVDVDGARRNLQAEIPRFDFDKVHEEAREKWAAALNRFKIEGATPQLSTIFATALYHSFLAPNVFSDVDGRYRGMDGEIHRAQGRKQYTVFSLWDTYRATHPLLTLVEPRRTREFLQTFLAQYRQGGRLPVWELAANETDCMIAYHSVSVIADAWMKGIRTDEGKALLKAMLASANADHFGLAAYRREGFIDASQEAESVSKTLEYAYDDWCIARVAESLGEKETAREFYRRAQAWRYLFDPSTHFFRPRKNGGWLEPFDPRRIDSNFTEANAWQYRFAAPQDVESLIESFGGDEPFVAALDSMFSIDSKTTGRDQADITGMIGQYAQGNEPSHHVAWLYHFAGRPDLSARRVERIRSELYRARPDGLAGNEDCGQMSSWYVFAAMGLYPVTPGSGEYLLVPPAFDRVTLRFDSTKSFTITRKGEGAYVQSASLDSKPLKRSWISHEELLHSRELVLKVGDIPSEWGRAPQERPHSRIPLAKSPLVAWIESPASSFRDSLVLQAHSTEPGAQFRWEYEGDRVEGAELVLHESARVLLFASAKGKRNSPALHASFWRIPHDWTVEVESVPNSQYTAGGPVALIDGRRGTKNWRTGAWQGYQGQDFWATVDFGVLRSISSAAAGFLQDQRSWILMPRQVIFEASKDGEHFEALGSVTPHVADRFEGVTIEDLKVQFPKRNARYLRVHALNYGTLPQWHQGAGGEAFIFIDEIFASSQP
jgi:predicted alpha-1,2-mannosidase